MAGYAGDRERLHPQVQQLGIRNWGMTLPAPWLKDIGAQPGDTIGIDRTTDDDGERCFVLRLADYDDDRVDF